MKFNGFSKKRATKNKEKSIKNVTENAIGFSIEILITLARFWLDFGSILASKIDEESLQKAPSKAGAWRIAV